MASGVVSCNGCFGRCCREYLVPITGADIWRIARTHHLMPMDFVSCDVEESPTPAGVLLRLGGPTYALALQHHQPRAHERVCMFLNPDGRCSIYADRPLVCQTYPMYLRKGIVTPREDLLCPDGSWAGIERTQAAWRARIIAQEQAWQDYALVVAAWNGAIRSLQSEAGAVLAQYLDYLMCAYDLLLNRSPEMAMDDLHTLAVSIIGVPASSP